MRNVVLFMSMSLDGYSEGLDRDISWHRVDEDLHHYLNQRLRPAAAFLSGRVTHELMAAFWPTADAAPDASPAVAEFAEIWRTKPKTAYSRTLTADRLDWNTTVRHEVDPAEIRALQAAPADGDLGDGELVVGGAVLARTFRELDLIDAYHICVHPVILGRGRPLFQELTATQDLRLLDARTFGNGVVALEYARDRRA
ncbi:dihydrofolate reductase family protein [Streptacidiphilus fuscans]|uniref:Dihydrofolate reductase family protein n=1 Tax=Streptacidiphilus fuscans TaxID=2789292 RepID=A0A931FGP3_9ACTN|nr:dihydrofolate reductase family protein [Streptacidiphilus fuscans]MBF9069784.1 dihydrofolate reductase family protein [Streptacidiphilus fuscans]